MRRMLDSSEIPWKAGLRKVSRVSSRGVRTEIPRLETGDTAPAPAQHLLCIVCGTVALLAYSAYSGYSPPLRVKFNIVLLREREV